MSLEGGVESLPDFKAFIQHVARNETPHLFHDCPLPAEMYNQEISSFVGHAREVVQKKVTRQVNYLLQAHERAHTVKLIYTHTCTRTRMHTSWLFSTHRQGN